MTLLSGCWLFWRQVIAFRLGALSCKSRSQCRRERRSRWIKLGVRRSDHFNNHFFSWKGEAWGDTPACCWPSHWRINSTMALSGGALVGPTERTLAERLSERTGPTCDDVILRQGLGVLLLPLAFHHTQHGAPAFNREVRGQRLFSSHWKRKKFCYFCSWLAARRRSTAPAKLRPSPCPRLSKCRKEKKARVGETLSLEVQIKKAFYFPSDGESRAAEEIWSFENVKPLAQRSYGFHQCGFSQTLKASRLGWKTLTKKTNSKNIKSHLGC